MYKLDPKKSFIVGSYEIKARALIHRSCIQFFFFLFFFSLSNVSHIHKILITISSEKLEIFFEWLERDTMRRNLLESFWDFKKCVSTFDCFEVFTERPFGLTTWPQTWSNNKHHHAIKYLIGYKNQTIVYI